MARVTLALAIVLSLAIATPAARAADRCRVPKNAVVKARTERAVVYRIDRAPPAPGYYFRELVGCLERVGKPVHVEYVDMDGGDVTRIGRVAVAGSRVAYAYRFQSRHGTADAEVRLVDLADPDRRWSAGGESSFHSVAIPRLVLAPDGAVAYTIRWHDPYAPPTPEIRWKREVRSRDAFGRRVLDAGDGIDLRSLELDGRSVAWTNAGERSTARLRRSFGRCRLPGDAEVRARGRRVIVFSPDDDSRQRAGGALPVYACLGRTGARQRISVEDVGGPLPRASRYRLAGPFVAWAELSVDPGNSAFVVVHDLRRHSRRSAIVATDDAEDWPPDGAVRVLLLAPWGDVAWTVLNRDDHLVGALDACGRRTLDDNRSIDLDSLRRHGRTLRWTAGDVGLSAKLRRLSDC